MIGGIVGGAVYLITTPQNQWNLGDGLLVAATGALAGGLIGTGVGATAGATLASGGFMAASTAAIHTGAGVGIAVGGGSPLRDNHLSGEGFHAGEFIINSAAGGIGSALTAGTPGVGLVPAVVRASASGSANMLGYVGAEQHKVVFPQREKPPIVLFIQQLVRLQGIFLHKELVIFSLRTLMLIHRLTSEAISKHLPTMTCVDYIHAIQDCCAT
ncbi:MAG: hypothetical protein BWY63_00990 [Chloroflexi bacterium ADurb.Bin360]|nr:MAG: hypothetical protein BWY63_00990 [Chloroflexi bacterium ADurb.Bin360]